MAGSEIKSFRIDIFSTPLKRPFITALGRKTETVNVGIVLTLRGGATGYGEASASLALAHLKPARLAAVLKSLGRGAIGQDAGRAALLGAQAWKNFPEAAPAVSAFECALVSAWARSTGVPLSRWWGGKLDRLETDITISAGDDAATAQACDDAAREGFRTLKIKVGGPLAENLARVRAAVRGAGRSRRVILDGNQGLTSASALRLVETCLKEGVKVALLEQPLAKNDWRGMAALTRRSPVPIAADEMVMTPQDAVRLADLRAAHAINIKLAKSGIFRSLQIAAVARAAGLELMIGCMAETAAGLAPSVHLAMGTGFFRYVDLDSDHLLKGGKKSENWRREGRFLRLNDE